MGKFESLEQQLDLLNEVGNIGAGNAATALSMLLNKGVSMSVAKVNIKDISELESIFGSGDTQIAAMLIEVEGDLSGMLILALELESAHAMVNAILVGQDQSADLFNEMSQSVLCETGNILAGSYLNALSTFINIKVSQSVPQMAIDMAVAILSYPAVNYITDDSAVMFVETNFMDDDRFLNGTYILVLGEGGFNTIVSSLEKLYG